MSDGERVSNGGFRRDAALLEAARYEVKKVVVGQDHALERLLVCLLAGGHCLLEGLPGLAKTLTVQTLAAVMGGRFARIQFTPDLVPSDIVGTRVYRASTERFDVELGPIFANFVLADEINRAPAKVQSALLEVMAEGHVTLAGHSFPAPRPFLVLATQNPIVNGGAIALGHPFGMTGARIMTTLLNGLEDSDKTVGLEAMCVGGGQGMAMIVERL
jgi:MoxR-like ATPase